MGVTATAVADWVGSFFATDAAAATAATAADVGAGAAATDVGLTAAEWAPALASVSTGTGAALGADAAGIGLDAATAASLGSSASLGAGAAELGAGAAELGAGAAELGAGSSGAGLASNFIPAAGETATINVEASGLGGAAGTAAGGGGGGLGALGLAVPGAASMLLPSSKLAAGSADAGGGTSMLPATTPSDTQSLNDIMTNLLGVQDQIDAGTVPSLGDLANNPDLADISFDPNSVTMGADTVNGPDMMDWFKNPKNLATAGLLGMSARNILSPPKLPGTAQTAAGIAGPAAAQAQAVIASGGAAGPAWAQQKASIDATINQQIQQQTESLMQADANSGMQGPGAPTGVVQQQISTMTSQLNTQRQQLYEQALAQNVQQAISELTGANQVLMGSANLQYQEDLHAQELALQAAALAAKLYALSG